jgi:hypothetical protein
MESFFMVTCLSSGDAYLNFGIGTTLMWGGGNEGSLDALPMPLGSTLMLFMPPTLAGPCGIPLTGTFPDPASPAIRAKEADGALTRRSARATLAEIFDMVGLQICLTGFADVRYPRCSFASRDALGSTALDVTKVGRRAPIFD